MTYIKVQWSINRWPCFQKDYLVVQIGLGWNLCSFQNIISTMPHAIFWHIPLCGIFRYGYPTSIGRFCCRHEGRLQWSLSNLLNQKLYSQTLSHPRLLCEKSDWHWWRIRQSQLGLFTISLSLGLSIQGWQSWVHALSPSFPFMLHLNLLCFEVGNNGGLFRLRCSQQ